MLYIINILIFCLKLYFLYNKFSFFMCFYNINSLFLFIIILCMKIKNIIYLVYSWTQITKTLLLFISLRFLKGLNFSRNMYSNNLLIEICLLITGQRILITDCSSPFHRSTLRLLIKSVKGLKIWEVNRFLVFLFFSRDS